MMTSLRRLVSPRIAPALVLFAFMLAHGLLETARDALFLTRIGPDRLAWAYLAIAAIALLAVVLLRDRLRNRDLRRILVGMLAGAALGTFAIAITVSLAPSIVFVLYVWTGLVATLVVPCFWLVVERTAIVSDAKRTFATIAAGGGIGALAGSGTAAVVGSLLGAEVLVVIAAVVLAAAALVAHVHAPPGLALHAGGARQRTRAAAALRSQRYVRLLLLLGVVATIALTLGDLMFKRVVASFAGDELAAVFGTIYAVLNLLALFVQLFVTTKLLDRFGVGSALTVLPIVLLATTLGFALTGAAIMVVALRVGDGALRHSVHRVASEILFIPLPASMRDATKPMIDVIAQRGGQVAAALLALAIASNGTGTWQLAAMLAFVTALWLAVIAATRKAYVHQFRDMIAAGEIHRDARLPTLDGNAVSMLTASLSSPDENEAMAALDLLGRRGDRIPALVLYHPSSTIVRKALGLLDHEVRPDVARVLEHLVTHPDPQIRAAALAASSRTGRNCEQLRGALHDPEPDVRAAAAIGLASGRKAEPVLAQQTIAALLAGTTEERGALARAISHHPREAHRELLDQLLARREPAVVREVLRVWTSMPALGNIDRLLLLLEDPHVRGEARRVFTAGGTPYLERAIAALDDPRTSLAVRRHLPRTISRFRTPKAAAALVARLVREPDGMTEFKILRALGRLRADNPALPIDVTPIRTYVRRAIDDASRYALLGSRLRQEQSAKTPASELLADLLSEKRRYAIDRVFRALGILYPHADMRQVHDAITSADDVRVAAAFEIIDGLVDAELRPPLVALMMAEHAPTARVNLTYEELLSALLVDPSDSLRSIAAHHVAERRLVALRGALIRLRPTTASPVVLSAFDQAIERLDA